MLNVGAGTGSYESRDRAVLAVEPSAVMIARSVVIVTASDRLNQFWLIRDYFPAIAWRCPEIPPEHIAALLGGDVRVEPLPVPRDCLDGFGEAFWARPALPPSAGTKGFDVSRGFYLRLDWVTETTEPTALRDQPSTCPYACRHPTATGGSACLPNVGNVVAGYLL